jgi:hypothetical protein
VTFQFLRTRVNCLARGNLSVFSCSEDTQCFSPFLDGRVQEEVLVHRGTINKVTSQSSMHGMEGPNILDPDTVKELELPIKHNALKLSSQPNVFSKQ